MNYDNVKHTITIEFDGRNLIEWIGNTDNKLEVELAATSMARRVYYEVLKFFKMVPKLKGF